MEINQYKKVYCVGIGGIGVSALARLFKALGAQVSGSDMRSSQVTESLEKSGIKVHIGHNIANIQEFNPELVIYSEDVSEGSAGFLELQMARQLDKVVLTQAEALAAVMEHKYGIGVTGTNGKSTTTVMLGLMLEKALLDPIVLAGTMLSIKNESEQFKANTRFGNGEYVVAEADEYRAKMLLTHPKMIVITNIAEDHLDFYKDLNDIKEAFSKYVASLPKDGVVVYNADDHTTVEVCRQVHCHKATFGINHYADLQAVNIRQEAGKQVFDMHYKDESIGEFELRIPGVFNISNALAASLAAIRLGVSKDIIRATLANFYLPWRRFESVGHLGRAEIISDYAHHPAGVEATIQAAQTFYPGKNILVVFQPHHRNRTKMLFRDFVTALMPASKVIIPEIFDVAGREHGEEISSNGIVQAINAEGGKAEYASNLLEAEQLIRSQSASYDVILMMGAGDIDSLARKLGSA